MLISQLNDPRSYAENIARITNSPKLFRELQVSLRNRQRNCFSPASTVNSYLSLIENLVKKHDVNRFYPISLAKLPIARHYWLRRYRFWLPTRIILIKLVKALRIHWVLRWLLK